MSSPSMQGPTDSPLFAQVMMLARGYATSACLHTAAKFGIADLLSSGPKAVSELARESKANEDALYRVLRALASINVFRETAPRTFVNTPISETLRSDIAGSTRDAVLFMADELHMRIYSELAYSVETGGTTFRKITGMEPFEFFRQNSEENRLFNSAMTSISAGAVPSALQAYDFGESGTLADIGCGHGALLTGILQKHGGLRGIAFDLPNVVEGAKERYESLGLASRCEVFGGSFFEGVPAADSYVMKSIIHDWDDSRAVAILKNCAKAMRGPNGKVILLEMVVGPANEPGLAKWIDIEMLVIAGGRERTEAEFADLFSKAGLKLSRVVRTPSPFCVIEAVKAQ
ncbi:MAG TPA: methyltransferase [Candidatus Acidoferrales bacterium]|nr:methyltransferase [Candidatus Acidoferrales bacterium]